MSIDWLRSYCRCAGAVWVLQTGRCPPKGRDLAQRVAAAAAAAAACGGTMRMGGCVLLLPLRLFGSGRLAQSAAISGPEPAHQILAALSPRTVNVEKDPHIGLSGYMLTMSVASTSTSAPTIDICVMMMTLTPGKALPKH